LRTLGCSTSGWPASGPKPVITLTTPLGKPACSTSSISARVEADVNSDGLITTVLPAASAGASLNDNRSSGEFQGVIIATTPSGSCLV
jgi:hypothetical protein